MRAWIRKAVSLGMSVLCMTLLGREERFTTVNWGQKCPASLWERENHRPGSDRPPDYVLTGSKRVKTLCWPSAEWCEAPGSVSNSERGDEAPWKEETEETSNCCPHVSDCCFRLPGGGIGGCLWRRWANFCSHVLRMKKKHWAYLTLHFMDFPYGRISMHI